MAAKTGFEPVPHWLTASCSNQTKLPRHCLVEETAGLVTCIPFACDELLFQPRFHDNLDGRIRTAEPQGNRDLPKLYSQHEL